METKWICSVVVQSILVCYFVYRLFEAVEKLQEGNIGTSYQTVHRVHVEESRDTNRHFK